MIMTLLSPRAIAASQYLIPAGTGREVAILLARKAVAAGKTQVFGEKAPQRLRGL